MGPFMARSLLWNFILKSYRATALYQFIHISEIKKRQTAIFHDVIEIGNICFILERKSLSASQSSEVFDGLLLG